jgi:hypothetical protein
VYNVVLKLNIMNSKQYGSYAEDTVSDE